MTTSEVHKPATSSEPGARGMVRAYWVAQGGEFLRHHFAPEIRSQIEHAFSSELNSALTGHGMSDWVGRSHLIELLEATAKARGGLEASADLAAAPTSPP